MEQTCQSFVPQECFFIVDGYSTKFILQKNINENHTSNINPIRMLVRIYNNRSFFFYNPIFNLNDS